MCLQFHSKYPFTTLHYCKHMLLLRDTCNTDWSALCNCFCVYCIHGIACLCIVSMVTSVCTLYVVADCISFKHLTNMIFFPLLLNSIGAYWLVLVLITQLEYGICQNPNVW